MELADHNPFEETTLEELQTIYRWISTHAYCFIMEVDGNPIGECWLQRMNLQRIVAQFPDKDLRRIDLMIGEKELWGRGYGTEVIGLLVEFGFQKERADAIFAPVAAKTTAASAPSKRTGSPATPASRSRTEG